MPQSFIAIHGPYADMVKLLFQESCQQAYLEGSDSSIAQTKNQIFLVEKIMQAN